MPPVWIEIVVQLLLSAEPWIWYTEALAPSQSIITSDSRCVKAKSNVSHWLSENCELQRVMSLPSIAAEGLQQFDWPDSCELAVAVADNNCGSGGGTGICATS